VRRFNPAPKDCDELHAVVGLAIALAIDATVLDSRSPPPAPVRRTAPQAEEGENPLAPRPEKIIPAGPSPPTALWSGRLALVGGLSVGTPPGLAGIGRFSFEASWREWVDIRIGVLGGSTGRQPAGSGTAVFSVAGALLDVCAGPRLARIVRPRLCVGSVAGAAIARGEGFVDDLTSRLPWMAVSAEGNLRVRVATRIEVELAAGAVANVVRPAFDFIEVGALRRVGREFPLFGGLFSAGLALSLW
jgi:hypothetical protein